MKTFYHTCGGTSGYRLIRDLLFQGGIKISYTTAYKYMSELGLKATILRKKQPYVKGVRHKVFDNLINRNFHAEKPNLKWCTDFTYLSLVGGQKRYNCSIIDLYDRSIVATLNSKYIDSTLAEDTLKLALAKHKISENLILHSDQGSQFCSHSFTNLCLEKGITQSMSRAGCPYDNAVMERFYNTFKNELIHQYHFYTEESLDEAIIDYVYDWYNYKRPHTYNNGLPPFHARVAA